MASRRRVGAFAAAAAAVLVAPILTASPALAARPALNPDSCADEGGVFSRQQGTRICLIWDPSLLYETLDGYSAAQPVPGLVATWSQIRGRQFGIMKTQKGNGPVQTFNVVAGVLTSLEITNKACGFDDGTQTAPVAVSQCEDAELYPLGF